MPQVDVLYHTPAAGQVTTNSYADLVFQHPTIPGGSIIVLRNMSKGDGYLIVRNLHGVNTIERQVLCAHRPDLPDAQWTVLSTVQSIAPGLNGQTFYALPLGTFLFGTYIKVQVRAQVPGSQGVARGDFRLRINQ